ncbi:MAG TPA: hypothetical protein PKH07_15500, partial [bacterium]|nr:hypothetical protein [bacterium]
LAGEELRHLPFYDYAVVNNTIEESVELIRNIIVAERCRRERVLHRLACANSALRNWVGAAISKPVDTVK